MLLPPWTHWCCAAFSYPSWLQRHGYANGGVGVDHTACVWGGDKRVTIKVGKHTQDCGMRAPWLRKEVIRLHRTRGLHGAPALSLLRECGEYKLWSSRFLKHSIRIISPAPCSSAEPVCQVTSPASRRLPVPLPTLGTIRLRLCSLLGGCWCRGGAWSRFGASGRLHASFLKRLRLLLCPRFGAGIVCLSVAFGDVRMEFRISHMLGKFPYHLMPCHQVVGCPFGQPCFFFFFSSFLVLPRGSRCV